MSSSGTVLGIGQEDGGRGLGRGGEKGEGTEACGASIFKHRPAGLLQEAGLGAGYSYNGTTVLVLHECCADFHQSHC